MLRVPYQALCSYFGNNSCVEVFESKQTVIDEFVCLRHPDKTKTIICASFW